MLLWNKKMAMWCGQSADFRGDSVADVVRLGERLGLHDVSDLMSRSTKRPVRLRSRRDISLSIYSYPSDEDVKLLVREAEGGIREVRERCTADQVGREGGGTEGEALLVLGERGDRIGREV